MKFSDYVKNQGLLKNIVYLPVITHFKNIKEHHGYGMLRNMIIVPFVLLIYVCSSTQF